MERKQRGIPVAALLLARESRELISFGMYHRADSLTRRHGQMPRADSRLYHTVLLAMSAVTIAAASQNNVIPHTSRTYFALQSNDRY